MGFHADDAVMKIRSEAQAKARAKQLALTWKNPRFYLILFTVFPLALPVALLVGLLTFIQKGLEVSLEWFNDHWYNVMQPCRDFIARGAK